MSKYKGPMTAAELMARLQADPEYQQRMAQKDQALQERIEANRKAFKPCLEELHRLGFAGESLEAIVKTYSPLPGPAVKVLLSFLGTLTDPRHIESVVRALGAAAAPFDGRPLARCFESTDDEALKWAIANTIALARPHSIEDWLSELRKCPHWDKTLQALGLEG